MTLQILQYEFLGPIPLSEWGPPMGDLVYAILSADKDRFNMLYVGDCEHTDETSFFVQHEQFKCWIQRAGSESALSLAVFPMKGSDEQKRRAVLRRIISNYRPPCNPADNPGTSPSYRVRSTGGDGGAASDDDGKDSTTAAGGGASAHDDPENGAAGEGRPGPESGAAHGAVSCPCCGSSMEWEKSVGTGSSSLYRCKGCGMTETRMD